MTNLELLATQKDTYHTASTLEPCVAIPDNETLRGNFEYDLALVHAQIVSERLALPFVLQKQLVLLLNELSRLYHHPDLTKSSKRKHHRPLRETAQNVLSATHNLLSQKMTLSDYQAMAKDLQHTPLEKQKKIGIIMMSVAALIGIIGVILCLCAQPIIGIGVIAGAASLGGVGFFSHTRRKPNPIHGLMLQTANLIDIESIPVLNIRPGNSL